MACRKIPGKQHSPSSVKLLFRALQQKMLLTGSENWAKVRLVETHKFNLQVEKSVWSFSEFCAVWQKLPLSFY